jgi:FkbM family methyltransferase
VSTLSNADHVRLIYRHLLSRDADPDGLSHFTGLLDRGHDLRVVVESIVSSDEYRDRHRAPMLPPPPAHPQRPFVIIDLGARKLENEPHIYAPLLAAPNEWRCIGFEPQRHRIAERKALEDDPRLVLLDSFIGDGSTGTFYVTSEDGSSSLLRLNKAFNAHFDDISGLTVVDTRPVTTRRLDDVLRDEPHIDFLKLDIQGYEGRALSGAADVLSRTNVVHSEVFFGPMYFESALFTDIESTLRAAGFSFIDFHHLTRYEYIRVPQRTGDRERLIWGDAIFFRDLPVRPESKADLAAQATIASLVYGKHGLAQTLSDLAVRAGAAL